MVWAAKGTGAADAKACLKREHRRKNAPHCREEYGKMHRLVQADAEKLDEVCKRDT